MTCVPMQEWLQEHAFMEINEVVVMYLDASEIHRPDVPDDVSPISGILSHYSFMLLSRGVYAMREWSCWCPPCSRVRGRGPPFGTISEGRLLSVPGCKRVNLTVWREGEITTTKGSGIVNRRRRLAEVWREIEHQMAPGKFACVQVRELWSTTEERHYRPGHHWVCELGAAADGSCVEKSFDKLPHRSWVVYKGVRFYTGEKAICVKRWLHRIDSDSSGLTFEQWNPLEDEIDPNAQPAFMIVSSSELRGVATLGFSANAEIQEVVSPALQALRKKVSGRTRAAASRDLSAIDGFHSQFALRPDIDNKWRERCE